jgi:hypothetical protein
MSGCGYATMATTQARGPDPAKLQQQLFSKVDANGDESIDKAELTSFLNFVSEKTGGGSVPSPPCRLPRR